MPPRDLLLNPPIPALYPERDALLAAVRDAHPDDDLPALVYADWQDEHGQPEHAELIRVMVELAKVRGRKPEAKIRRPKLLARRKELFKTPALKPLKELFKPPALRWDFERGFVRNLDVCWIELPREVAFSHRNIGGPPHQLDIPSVLPFDKVAWLGVVLDDERPAEKAVATLSIQPWLRRADRLILNQYGEGSINRAGTFLPLAASEHLGGLRAIEVWGGLVVAEDVAALHLAHSAVGLREFNLGQWQTRISSPKVRRHSAVAYLLAVEQIVSAKRAKQFTSFGEEVAEVDEPLAKILLASKHLTGIRTFRYLFGKITAKTWAVFIERFGLPMRS